MSLIQRIRQRRTTLRAGMKPQNVMFSAFSALLLVTSPMLMAAETLKAKSVEACLIQTIETSLFSPPSPDPAGITYIQHTGRLLVSDSEVNEMDIFEGKNLFEMSLSGTLSDTSSTIPLSKEPTGVTYNPINGHLFFSDDNLLRVFEVDPGADGKFDTGDNIVASFDTAVFGSYDPEGIAFDFKHGVLYLVDGLGAEVYRISAGDNEIFDGQPPEGDDRVTHFDIAEYGMTDPEGIAYDPKGNRLLVVGLPNDMMIEIKSNGDLVRAIDISAAGARKPAGVTLAPGSIDDNGMSIYIVDRGVDNSKDPAENDGKVYEMSLACKNGKGLRSEGGNDE